MKLMFLDMRYVRTYQSYVRIYICIRTYLTTREQRLTSKQDDRAKTGNDRYLFEKHQSRFFEFFHRSAFF